MWGASEDLVQQGVVGAAVAEGWTVIHAAAVSGGLQSINVLLCRHSSLQQQAAATSSPGGRLLAWRRAESTNRASHWVLLAYHLAVPSAPATCRLNLLWYADLISSCVYRSLFAAVWNSARVMVCTQHWCQLEDARETHE
jgi:hypothetical protein